MAYGCRSMMMMMIVKMELLLWMKKCGCGKIRKICCCCGEEKWLESEVLKFYITGVNADGFNTGKKKKKKSKPALFLVFCVNRGWRSEMPKGRGSCVC